ncbi:unnamed protein product, partial [Linum tenue]
PGCSSQESRTLANSCQEKGDLDRYNFSPYHSLTSLDDSPYVQGQLRRGFGSFQILFSRFQANVVQLSSNLGVIYQVLPCHVQVNWNSVQMVLTITIIFALIFLGILVFRIA